MGRTTQTMTQLVAQEEAYWAPFRRALSRPGNLFVRNVERLNRDSIVLGHMERERAPAATGLRHGFARLQP